MTSGSSLSDIVHQCALEEESESLHSAHIVPTNCDHDDEVAEADMEAMFDNVRYHGGVGTPMQNKLSSFILSTIYT